MFKQIILIVFAAAALSACSTYSSTTVSDPNAETTASASDPANKDAPQGVTSDRAPTSPSDVILTTDDITDRPYEVIGDIEVTVNKTTIFHPDPTRAHVDEKLREKAAELGADAVILVRYGTVGVSFMSWGSLDGQGRAVYFVN